MHKDYPDSTEDSILNRIAQSSPVILVGRGGSGTRLLSQLALNAGVFLGNELNVSLDSVEWVKDLYALAIASTSKEAHLQPIGYWQNRLRRCAAKLLAEAQKSPDTLWGWKLPETMLGLAKVLRAFPRARVVHLVRHPITSCLRRTHVTSRFNNPVGRAVLERAYDACQRDPSNMLSDPPYIHNAISWVYQLDKALEVFSNFAPNKNSILQLRYEDVYRRPEEAQEQLCNFLRANIKEKKGIEIDLGRTGNVCPTDPRIDEVWTICSDIATRLGYEKNMSCAVA